MVPGRGGVRVGSFDMDQVEAGNVINGVTHLEEAERLNLSEKVMFGNYVYFMKSVIPVAEEAGVKLALHPDDPPVPSLGGVARVFYKMENFLKAFDAVPSPNHGLDFCMGCFSEMVHDDNDGGGVIEAMRVFCELGKIFYVHFRDVQGCVPRFRECFPGEGNVDVVEAVRTLKEVGFTGFIIDDHVPLMLDDSDWRHRGHAYATGYITGLVKAVNRLAR